MKTINSTGKHLKRSIAISVNRDEKASNSNFLKHSIKAIMILAILLLFFSNSFSQTATAPTLGDGTAGNPYQIATLNNLYWIAANSTRWSYHYTQTANITASTTSNWFWTSGGEYAQGWIPIGNATTQFSGSYDGGGLMISSLYINRPTDDYIGLFGYVMNGTLKNLIIENAIITGNNNVGALVGYVSAGTIDKCSGAGPITGQFNVGGLAGYLVGTTNVSSCYSRNTATVSGLGDCGGLIGKSLSTGTVSNCYSWGTVIRSSGSQSRFGSFIGTNSGTAISNCYCTGPVTYSGSTNPTNKGFVGSHTSGTYSQNLYDTQTTGQSSTGSTLYATGKTTAEMTSYYTYAFTPATWDFYGEATNGTNSYWGYNTSNNNSYPFLYWQGFTNIAPPYVTTQATASITETTATGNGHIEKGTHTISQHGHCWSTTTGPTTANSKTTLGTGATGDFTSSITGLTSSTAYYIRAYTTTGVGTFYGNEVTFTTTAPKLNQTITFGPLAAKTYGNASFTISATATSGLTVTFTSSNTGVATVSGSTVTITGSGNVTITANQAGNATYNAAPAVPQVLSVGKKNLTVTGASVQTKTYDGNTDAAINGATLVGKVGSDDVTITSPATGTFDNKNAGTGKSVTATLTLSGTRATHYTLTQPTSLTGIISTKSLSVTGALVTAKVYDGNTNATITGGALSGVIGGDAVTLGNATSGTFNNKNVGTAKAVTSAMTISGTHASNYSITQPTISGNITAKGLTVTGSTAQNKVYDGTTTATVSGATLSGAIGGDVVSIANATSGTFASKNVANGISVTTAMTLTGTDAGNYTLTQPTGLTANITHKELTITGAAVTTKVYDATTDATITGATLSGVVGSDAITLGDETYGRFDSPSVGTRIPVTTAMTISGKAAGNYTLTQPTRLRGEITAKELTVTGTIASDKVYDGGTTASISGATLVGVFAGDDCTLTSTKKGTFSQSAAGNNIPVSTSMSLDGSESGNYTLTQPSGLIANITTKNLTVTANNLTKTFGLTYTFAGTEFTTSGLVGSDAVTSALFSSSGAGASAAVGTYPIVVGSATGSGLTNYTIGYAGGTLTVEERTELTLSGLTANVKDYDGTTTATISSYGTLTGVDPAHTVTLVTTGATANFADKNHGFDKLITVTGLALDGPDAAHYFIGNQTTTSIIHKRLLTLSNLHANDKIYNGYNYTTGSFDDDRIEGDDITFSYLVYFSSKTVGENKTVTFGTITINGGADQNNYYISAMTRQTTANITALEVEAINAVASNKVYNGNDIATITGATLSGAVSGDDVSLTNHTTGTFDSKNIGENKPVTINMALSGADAPNYILLQPSNLEADITAKELTVTGATAQNKNYDGNTDATITGATLIGKITEEDVQLENHTIGTFDNKNIGGSKPVSTSMTITGADIANYTFTPPTGLTASISTKTLTVSGTVANNKVYDGFTSGNLTGATLEGVVGTEDVSLSRETECHFTQATVGENIPVTTDAMTIIGSDIDNYRLQRPTGLTANITPKELTVVSAAAQNKVYDGNTNAIITGATLSGKVSGDDVTLANHTAGIFEHKNVGTTIDVIPSMTITGTGAFNYTLTQPTGLKANITAKGLTVTGATAQNKEYNRDANATITGAALSGKIGSDDVTLTNHTTGTFSVYNVGENIEVTTAMRVAGNDATNYNFTQPTGLTANITTKGLFITANDIEKNQGETYTFAGTEFTSTGLISGDEITSATLNSDGADASATDGDYPITIGSAIGSGLTNYNIQYIEGTFTVIEVTTVPDNLDLPNEDLGNGAIECYNAQNNITVAGGSNSVILRSGSTSEFIAGASIRFLPGFYAHNGSNVYARITTTGDFCETTSGSIVEVIADKAGTIDETEKDVKEFQPFHLKEKTMKVYPNPNNGQFNLALSGFENKTDITVFSIQGKVIFRKTQIDSDFMEIALPAVRAGIYSIHINDGETVKSVKMIVQ